MKGNRFLYNKLPTRYVGPAVAPCLITTSQGLIRCPGRWHSDLFTMPSKLSRPPPRIGLSAVCLTAKEQAPMLVTAGAS